jgi:hypothetical protein
MGHLKPEVFIDIIEGARAEAATPHLAGCAACRRQLADLRAVSLAAADLPVPEPSPLFWDHFSDRVRQVVAAEEAPRRRPWLGDWSWSQMASTSAVAAAAVVAVAALITLVVPQRHSTPDPATLNRAAIIGSSSDIAPLGLPDDPSLLLVADLTAEMDWESANEAGISSRFGGADDAVSALNDVEREELQRLLKEALAKPGV